MHKLKNTMQKFFMTSVADATTTTAAAVNVAASSWLFLNKIGKQKLYDVLALSQLQLHKHG